MNIATLFDRSHRREFDPTGTAGLRKKFRNAGMFALNGLRGQLRQAVMEFNILGLQGDRNTFRPQADHLQQFSGWLEAAARSALDAKWWSQSYLDQAIAQGIETARQELKQTLHPAPTAFATVHQAAKGEMNGIQAALVQKLSRSAENAMSRRAPPSIALNAMTTTLDGDIANRVQAFTNTFAVKAYNKGKLETYRAGGVGLVGVHPELKRMPTAKDCVTTIKDDLEEDDLVGWLTANDDLVCEDCEDGEAGSPYTLDEASALIPAHPNCRCAVYPWSGSEYGDAMQSALGFQVPLAVKLQTQPPLRKRMPRLSMTAMRKRRIKKDEDTGHPFRGNQYTSGESGGGSHGSSGHGRTGKAPVVSAQSSRPRTGFAGLGSPSAFVGSSGHSGPEGSGRTGLTEMIGGADEFHAAISAAKSANSFGAAVTLHSVDDYRKDRLFITPDQKAGFALQGDEIVSVFKHPDANIPHFAQHALALAVEKGGRRLDAFDTVLPHIYSQAGFRAVARTHFDDNYKPEGWDYKKFSNYNGGRPDVVFMVYDPEHAQPYKPGDGQLVSSYDEGAKLQQDEVARLSGSASSPKWTRSSDDGSYSNGSEKLYLNNYRTMTTGERVHLKNDIREMDRRASQIESETSDPQEVQEYNAINMIAGAAHHLMAAPDRFHGAILVDNNGKLQGAVSVSKDTHSDGAKIDYLGTLKRGMGEHLLKLAENIARDQYGAKEVHLTALPAAGHFYERHGYQNAPDTDEMDFEYVKHLKDAEFEEISEPEFLCAGDLAGAIELRRQRNSN